MADEEHPQGLAEAEPSAVTIPATPDEANDLPMVEPRPEQEFGLPLAELGNFLRQLTPDDAPFELTIGYGPIVSARSGTYSSIDGSPFWYVVGRFGQFDGTDAEPAVDRTSVEAAVAAALFDLAFDLLVVRGHVEAIDPRGDVS